VKVSILKFSGLNILYAALIFIWFASWLTVGDATWWLVIINRIVPYLFVLTPLLLIWGIFSRRLRSSIVLVVPFLIFVWMYYPYLLPKSLSPVGNRSQLSVMTYNVLFSNSNYEAVADVILTYSPDLVALQEVTGEMMDSLEELLVSQYPFSQIGTDNDYGTTAIFSKYPITSSEVLELMVDRPAVVVRVDVNGREVIFVSVHLFAYNLWWTKLRDVPDVVMQRTFDQNRQVTILLDDLEKEDGILIVGCDCNSYETSSSYRILEKSMDNTAREVGWLFHRNKLGDTRPDTSLQHIDYIWFRGLLNPLWIHKIQDNGGSDHQPVLAAFEVP
jgi:endonuclease/exonuclease/phosphatase (EEP) superfamily protein YafD